MGTTIEQPRWGFVELVLTYASIIVIGVVFGLYGETIGDLVRSLGIPDTMLTYFSIGFIIQFISTVILVLFFTVLINKASIGDLGVKKARSRTDYIKYGLAGGMVLMLVILLLGIPINYLRPDIKPQLYEEMLRSVAGFSQFAVIFIMGTILAPLSEELLYRGMMYPIFRKYLGPGWGAIAAGLVFGLAHWDLWRLIPLSVGGAILCRIYEKTGSILVSALAHGVWNAIMSVMVYISISSVV